MISDVVRLILVVAVAYAAYALLLKGDSGLIKNTGYLSVGGDETLGSAAGADAPLSAPMAGVAVPEKRVVNTQIDDLTPNEDLMAKVKKDQLYQQNTNVLPYPQISQNFSAQGNFQPSTMHNFAQLDCFPKDQLTAKDLLPREGGFSESNPTVQGHLSNRNFFESGYHAGLNTQSSTLKNPNLQLRSDPLIPRRDVGPWSQSTYEPDTNRRQFEIGGI